MADLILSREDAKARHIVQAIGSSSFEKGSAFVAKHIPGTTPKVYGSYDELYQDPDVDIVYIGTPHAFHKKNCLGAIAAGKHVLCEKAFTITSREAEAVFVAARAKDIFIMEAMWTRFTPLVLTLQKKLFEEKVIGDVRRTFCDFGLDMDIAPLGVDSRLKNPGLGVGSLLDIGIYSLTWGPLTLDARIGEQAEKPNVVAVQTLSDQIDISSSVLLQYPSTGRQGILTSTTESKTDRTFCRIEGAQGYITVEGIAASAPDTFIVYSENSGSAKSDVSGMTAKPSREVFKFDRVGMGFYWEADAVAVDIVGGKRENAIMPHAETLRLMKDFRRNQKTRRSKISSG